MSAEHITSFPNAPIRHNYPVSRIEVDLTTATEILKQTIPIIKFRLIGLISFSLCLLACTSLFAYVLNLAAEAGQAGWLKWGGLYIGAIISLGVYPFLRDILFSEPRLLHSILLAEALVKGDISAEPDQRAYSKDIVVTNLGGLAEFQALGSGVKQILNEFHANVGSLSAAFPNVKSEAALSFLCRRVNYLPELVQSYCVARGDDNVLRAAKDGVVYYAQNWPTVLRTAIGCWIAEGVVTIGGFMIALGPSVFLGFLVPEFLRGWMTFFAVLLVFNIKDAVIHPLFLAFTMERYHMEMKGQRFKEEVEHRLLKMSESFKELSDEAAMAGS